MNHAPEDQPLDDVPDSDMKSLDNLPEELRNLLTQASPELFSEQLSAPEDEEALQRAMNFMRRQLKGIRRRELRQQRKTEQSANAEVILERLERGHIRALGSSERSTRECLMREVGIIVDRHKACQAWLYVIESEDGAMVLRSRVSHGTNQLGRKVRLDEAGIVSSVANSKQARLVPDVTKTTDYVSCNDSTISELAVPVLDVNGNLIGVLNLESSVHRFTEQDEEAIKVDVRRLAVGVLCLIANGRERHWPWSPDRGNWSPRKVAQDVCSHVSASLSLSAQTDACSSIVWVYDEPKRQFWVLGTTSYDARFQADRYLPRKSYCGVVQKLRPGRVIAARPDHRLFREKARAEAAGLMRMVSAPLYRLPSEGVSSAWGVWHAYYFGQSSVSLLPSKEVARDIAGLVEGWLADYELLRAECARSYLWWKMESSCREWKKKNWRSGVEGMLAVLLGLQWNTLKEVLVDLLDADACTIFVPNQTRNRLIMVSSTGVGLDGQYDAQFLATGGDNRMPVYYEVSTSDQPNYGLLSYIHDHPASPPLRINSLIQFEKGRERGLPADLPRRVVRRHMEPLSRDTEDRRFLGAALVDQGQATAVIRIVRSISQPPFTDDDARLFQSLLRLCEQQRLWCGPESSSIARLPAPGQQIDCAG
jgi:GAF domain-containing protein